jgi:orotidine-5'-phosphate decarboxylase
MGGFTTPEVGALRGRIMPVDAKDRLIVALDFDSSDRAIRLVEKLDGLVSFFKVGIELQLAEGIVPVSYLVSKGKKVFLDLKYFDVPETVERAVRRAASVGASFLTIHGNRRNVEAAVRGRSSAGKTDLKLLSVTVLTSLDNDDIQDMGFPCSVEELALHRAKKSAEAGCDGVIASGQEAREIRRVVGDKLLIVTPGIRPEGFPKQDQKRTVTPKEAVLAGADYLVVGRYITSDPQPREAAERVIAETQEAFAARAQT